VYRVYTENCQLTGYGTGKCHYLAGKAGYSAVINPSFSRIGKPERKRTLTLIA